MTSYFKPGFASEAEFQKEELFARFVELRAQGKTLRECGKELNKPHSTMGHWNQRMAYEIQIARAEWLLRQSNVASEQQLKFYQDVVSKLQTALVQKDFGQLPAIDLVKLLNQLSANHKHSISLAARPLLH